MQEKSENTEIRFGNGAISAVGAVSGMGIAIGAPWVLLEHAAILGQVATTCLVVLALAMGGAISLVSAFFGLVMPRRVGGPFGDPKAWAAWGEKWRQWEREGHRRHGRHWGHGGDWENDADIDEEAKAAPRRGRR
jgi:hypothetical protein